MKKQTY
ncbi:hypothetical protein CJF32_00005016 [Rutstroemia sp. NJR-2017a WRK4]|nr:hypothetical protein CJF32_00005016 [Rutstroemia sp. NJR-2017a WRK4]